METSSERAGKGNREKGEHGHQRTSWPHAKPFVWLTSSLLLCFCQTVLPTSAPTSVDGERGREVEVALEGTDSSSPATLLIEKFLPCLQGRAPHAAI